MFFAKKFIFSPEEENIIVNSIKKFEKKTSGEIRVHISAKISISMNRAAIKTFKKLNMDQTELRNGVLIFIDFRRKKLVILGDKGINQKVPDGFWNDVLNKTIGAFKKEKFVQGITEAIYDCGEKLTEYFPYRENDKNELPDDISYS